MDEYQFIGEILREMSVRLEVEFRNRDALEVKTKSDPTDQLTQVDVAIQEYISGKIRDSFPDDLIIGEESNLHVLPDTVPDRTWFIDPVDGTQNFVRGVYPTFGTSLALAYGDEVVVGGVAFPGAGGVFLARRGEGAVRDDESLRVSKEASLDVARIEVDFSSPAQRVETLESFDCLMRESGQVRGHGAAVVGLCAVAVGQADAYLHVGINPWDYAAGVLLVEEAGGRVTSLDGSPYSLFGGLNSIVATNGLIHEKCLERIGRG